MKDCSLKSLLLTVMFLCTIIVSAETVNVNGITYDLVTKARVAMVKTGDTNYVGDLAIPDSIEYNGITFVVTSIGVDAFVGCSGLTSITIPSSITTIEESAFCYCSGLKSVTIPNSLTSIGGYAFSSCYNLEKVCISDLATWCAIDFKNVASNPLSYANNLYLNNELVTELTLPNNVVSIGNYAFTGCNFIRLTIPDNVTDIGKYAFYQCSALTDIAIGSGLKYISDYVFSGCTSLESVTIPNTVTKIGWHAFSNCRDLTSVTIGCNVTDIWSYAFYNCDNLTSITISNKVASIGGLAFSDCSNLTILKIGSGVTDIGSEAFAKCGNLTDVYCLSTTVPSTNATVFNESYPEYMTLHVPADAINEYKTTVPWSYFGKIVALNDDEVEEPEVKVCATPQISYSNGGLVIECETPDAEFVTELTCSDAKKFYESRIDLSATYNISVYATATGYDNSETVNATLCWIEMGDIEGDITDVLNIPATVALITASNGKVSVSSALNGASVAVYTVGGALVGSTNLNNGVATVDTGVSKGTVVIVKIGEKSVKLMMQ